MDLLVEKRLGLSLRTGLNDLNVLNTPVFEGRKLERAAGVEPATSSLGSWHSTTELRPLRVAHSQFLYEITTPLSMKSMQRPPASHILKIPAAIKIVKAPLLMGNARGNVRIVLEAGLG